MLVQFLGERLMKGRQMRRLMVCFALVFSSGALGQSNCQCDQETWAGYCEAEIIVAGDSALISTDLATKQRSLQFRAAEYVAVNAKKLQQNLNKPLSQ
jgi:hypothetical protein